LIVNIFIKVLYFYILRKKMLNNQHFAYLRAKSLGGSDIGTVLCFSRYRSAVDVWMEKTGRAVHEANSLPIRFGSFAEEFVASEYGITTGVSLVTYLGTLN
jgi:predicted phage-related endonuclease